MRPGCPGARVGGEVGLRWPRCVALAFFVTVLVVVVAPGVAADTDVQYAHNQSSDDVAPTIVNGTRVNDTAVRLTIADNHDIDESTVRVGEFASERGSITSVSATENGSNASVILRLDEPVDDDGLTLGAVGNTRISDTNGNTLSDADRTVTVRNMDGVSPRVVSFRVSAATGGPAAFELEATERLAALNISLGGAGEGYLTREDFSRDGSSLTYTAEYTPPRDGTLRATLFSYSDPAGNTRTLSFTERVKADLTPPDVAAGIDLAASGNATLVFDGSTSTDANGVATYNWTFGDGTTATGARVSHTFAPGTYTVTLEAADPSGNTATDTIPLNLTTGAGNVTDVTDSSLADRRGATAAVQRPDGTVSTDAVVTVDSARAGSPVHIGTTRANASAIVRHDDVTIRGLTVTVSTNRSLALGVSMAEPGSVSDAARATGSDALAGITVANTVPDRDVANVTVAFAVNRGRIDAADMSPTHVALARSHNGSWNVLPTKVTAERNGTVVFTADSPGFSRFAVLAGASTGLDEMQARNREGSRALSVTEAALNRSTVQQGSRVSVTVTVENAGTAAGTATAGLTLNGTVVATATSPSVPSGESVSFEIVHTATAAGTYTATVNGTAAGTLTVEPDSAATNGTSRRPQFVVTDVSLDRTATAPGETLVVNATVRNRGASPGVYTAGLAVNGGVVTTEQSPPIPGNATRTFSMRYAPENAGEFSLSVNGTTGGTVTVRASGGGLLAPLMGILAALPIPLGLLRPVFLFVVLPLTVVWAVLKALAIYLGY